MDKSKAPRVIKNRNDSFIDAAYEGKMKTIIKILKAGQPVDALHSYTQTTALSAAIDRGHYATSRTLLKFKADPNHRHPITGETALHRAAARGDPKIVSALLENNPTADRHIISKANQKPIDLAREYQWLEVSDILREPPSQPLVINIDTTPSMGYVTWNAANDNGTPIDFYELVYRPSIHQTEYSTGIDPVTKVKYWHHRETHEEKWAKPDEPYEDPVTQVAQGNDAPVRPGGIYSKHWIRDSKIVENKFEIPNLHPSYVYFLLIRAQSAAGWGPYSRVMTFVANDDITSEPSTPTLWSMTARAITIAWKRPEIENGGHIIFYQVDMVKGNTMEGNQIEWEKVTDKLRGEPEPKYRINGLKSGAEYRFRVRGKNKTGWSEWSGISESFKTNVAPSILHRSKSSITIHWMDWSTGDPENLVGFEVQAFSIPEVPEDGDEGEFRGDPKSDDLASRLGIPGGEVGNLPWEILTSTCKDTRFKHEGLLPHREFCYRVRTCFKDSGWDPWENAGETKVFFTKAAEPDPPAQIMLVAGTVTHESMIFRWGDPRANGQPIDSYKIYYRKHDVEEWTEDPTIIERRDVEGKANVGIHILPGEFEVHNLDYDTDYQFAIKAHNKIGWSVLGEETEFHGTLALEPPGKPRIVTCTDTLATIEWDPPYLTGRPVDKYDLQQRRWRFQSGLYSPMDWTLVERTKEPCSLVRELMPTAIYEFRVLAHTYAADLPQQWSQPSENSEKCDMRRRL